MSEGREDATRFLERIADGDQDAASHLLPLVYEELRQLAASYMRLERANHTLQPTSLVHEAYMRMIRQRPGAVTGRAHFCALAAEQMKRILIDHARKHRAAKRGGGGDRRVTLDLASDAPGTELNVDLLDLNDALERLSTLHERQQKVVELRYFGGLSIDDVAEVLGVSPRTVKGDWRVARAWLQNELHGSTS